MSIPRHLRTLILAIAICGFGHAGNAQFVAYNDHYAGPNTHSNATAWNVFGTSGGAPGSSGALKDITDGSALPITLSITNLGPPTPSAVSSGPAAGSPAALIFSNYVDFGNGGVGHAIQTSSNQVVAHIFSGLNTNRLYRFHGTAVVGSNTYVDRWILAELLGAVSFSNAHTAGAYTNGLATNQVAINTGDNQANGTMAVWTNIKPNSNGFFTVRETQYIGPLPQGGFGGTGAYGYAFTAIRLEELLAAPEIIAQPQGANLPTNTTMTFTVDAIGAVPLFYQWRKNGTSILNATNQSYTITNTTTSDAGDYSVVITNTFGSITSSNATLTLACVPVAFTVQSPSPRSVAFGKVLNIVESINQSASLPLTFHWYKDGVLLPGATNRNYAISKASNTDAGTYYMTVSNCANALLTSSNVVVIVDYANIYITNEPPDLTVVENQNATLTVRVAGDDPHYQWYKDQALIPGATSASLTFSNAALSDSGVYYVSITNVASFARSRDARLTVVGDTNGPTLVYADGTTNATNVTVTFSEPVLAVTATNLANYKITNTIAPEMLTITRAVLTNGTNVILTSSARSTGSNYILVVNNVRDISAHTNLISANSSIPIDSGAIVTVVAMNDGNWKFYDPYPPFDQPDLGTAWRNVGYDTSGWGDGSAVFFNGADSSSVPGPVGTQLSQTPTITSYFRNQFTLPTSPGAATLTLRHQVDDGAIFYLNGGEIFRFNMPAGAVNYQTPSSSAIVFATIPTAVTVSAPLLHAGQNLLAVELHQTASSDSDKTFGVEVKARAQSYLVGPVVITSGVNNQVATETLPLTLSVVQVGGSIFQWRSNGTNIPGATNSTYTIPSVTLPMNGWTFSVAVSNTTSGAISATGTVTVVTDTIPPTLVSATANTTNNTITVSYSEAVAALSAQAVTNYTVTNAVGTNLVITSALLTNGTNVILTCTSLPYGVYTVVVSNVRDASGQSNLIAPNSTITVGAQFLAFTMDAAWRYDQAGTDRGSGWTARTYNDSGWTGTGQAALDAKFGSRGAPLPQPILTTLSLSNANNTAELPTYYFRTHFNSFGATNATLTLRTLLDDGAVFYLNGVEIYRLGMQSGAILYNTLANRTVGDATFEGPFTLTATNLLLPGDNVFAVEAHQASLTSSDITWAGELSVSIPSAVGPPAPTGVQLTSQPLSQSVSTGACVSFSVGVTGTQPITYRWRKDGVVISSTNNNTATNQILTICNLQASDAGSYSVVVSNSINNVTSSNATLTVNGGDCTPITVIAPSLKAQRFGTNVVLSWSNPATNSCGAPAIFTLQGALYFSNAPSAIVWSNLTTSSPYTNAIPTNRVPVPFGARYFRLFKP